ncbi:MAG: hypothetical protein JRF51_01745 [Deltaproteobacteria bacterium]|nr:hypothetical protein [Deltaproteobacteria bacterium]
MKKLIVLIGVLILFPLLASGEDFLGAPVIPGGKTVDKTDVRLELNLPMSHDEVVSFYREALKDFENIKFREWRDATYIEDDGKMLWHSITISKGGGDKTKVVILKDNWTWIIGTLVLRYVAVFGVLMLVFLGMALSGSIISRSVKKKEKAG